MSEEARALREDMLRVIKRQIETLEMLVEAVESLDDPDDVPLKERMEYIETNIRLLNVATGTKSHFTMTSEKGLNPILDAVPAILIHNLRKHGLSWKAIGELTGMSTSGAFKRYGSATD